MLCICLLKTKVKVTKGNIRTKNEDFKKILKLKKIKNNIKKLFFNG